VQQDRSSLWTFSLAVYDNVAVKRECLDLQDRHSVDVNLLLFCAFVGAVHGAVLSQADLRQVEGVVHDWNAQVVHSLRKARHAVKSLSDVASPISFASFYSSNHLLKSLCFELPLLNERPSDDRYQSTG